MAIEKFLFTLVKPYSQGRLYEQTKIPGNGGVELVRDDTPDIRGQWRANIRVRLPHNGYTFDDLLVFWQTTRGGAQVFGIKDPVNERFYKSTLEALGTAVAAQTDFPLDYQYVDAATLLVYKDAVLQTLTTHYTLEDNETAPKVRFVSGLSGGEVITATYEFFIPVRADMPDSEWIPGGVNFDEAFEVYEYFAGARYVS